MQPPPISTSAPIFFPEIVLPIPPLSRSRSWIPSTVLVLIATALTLHAQSTESPQTIVLSASDHRPATSLDGDWHIIVDPYGNGLYDNHGNIRSDGYAKNAKEVPHGRPIEYDFSKAPTLRVPGDWNTQRESLMYYEGPLWYQKDFIFQKTPGKRTFLHIGAANYRSYVWINGTKICQHEGGYTGFNCDATSALKDGANFIIIAVDNTRIADGVPTLKTDWWNYGGLTRDISLIEVPEHFIDAFDLHLKRGTKDQIEGWVHVTGAPEGTPVNISIAKGADHTVSTVKLGLDGRAQIQFTDNNLQLWSPEHPTLYDVALEADGDQLKDEIGFRTIETKGTQILLNGTPIFLKGVCIHAEAPFRTGRAYSEQDAQTLLGWVKDLGGNYVRLAHYPHDEHMTRLADRMGIMVWSEVPVYWAVHFDDPAVLKKAQAQLHEMIQRDSDKASVILWSVANETPATPARTAFLTTLASNVHEQDPTRLVTAALLVRTDGMTKIVDDPLGKALDVIGTNEYVGWYEHDAADADNTTWDIRYQKPVIMSEFGGEAKAGRHGADSDRWTEEFQANIYRHQIVMLNKIPQLRGTTPWILMDFRSPLRELDGTQDNYNRKGLVSEDGKKKQAFFILQKAYTTNTLGHAE
jgi:beta-glucuronidase